MVSQFDRLAVVRPARFELKQTAEVLQHRGQDVVFHDVGAFVMHLLKPNDLDKLCDRVNPENRSQVLQEVDDYIKLNITDVIETELCAIKTTFPVTRPDSERGSLALMINPDAVAQIELERQGIFGFFEADDLFSPDSHPLIVASPKGRSKMDSMKQRLSNAGLVGQKVVIEPPNFKKI